MPSILSDEDKQTIKRQVPKASNKIQAVAVARLYIAHPVRSRWTYTGLQGAVVLSNDLVGNTYWLKLVDISTQNRGVIWDQEIYDTWSYNQDRTYFHTFELEDCLAGLSFADVKEAAKFLKKMNEREKNASKATRATLFGGISASTSGSRSHGILNGLFGGHRNSLTSHGSQSPTLSPTTSSNDLPRPRSNTLTIPRSTSEFAALDAIDPNWQATWGDDLKAMGITDSMIRENQDFIADYIRGQQHAATDAQPPGMKSGPPAPPPPRRGVAPAPPPSRRYTGSASTPPEASPSIEVSASRFAAPPPLADAGRYAASKAGAGVPASRARQLPPKVSDESQGPEARARFGVPPPFAGQAAPPTPLRTGGPPPPPLRTGGSLTPQREAMREPAHTAPPPLPPKTPNSAGSGPPPSVMAKAEPQPPRTTTLSASHPRSQPPLAPPLPPTVVAPPPPLPPTVVAPPPPPLPPIASAGASIPSAPPLSPLTSGVVPPAPPPPARDSGYISGTTMATELPEAGGRSGLLAGIKQAGGIGALKKVDRSQVRDRSAAMVAGASSETSAAPAPAGPAAGGLADALAVALNKRKQKVSASDDEEDDDEW